MRWVRWAVVAVALTGTALLALPGRASAHRDDESAEAGVLIRQAIALIVNTPDDLMAAAEKVDDALAAPDQEGVDIELVDEAARALADGDVHEARALLERSIGARPHLGDTDPVQIGEAPPLATGAQTGVDVVTDALPPDRDLTSWDWLVLAGLAGLGAIGVWLSVRFRPHHELGTST